MNEIMYPIVLAITGASAQPIAERTLQLLLSKKYQIHLILSKGAYEVWNSEIGVPIPIDPIKQNHFWSDRLEMETDKLICHKYNNNSASIASGSFRTKGMIIVPCTMGTIGRIAAGVSTDLIERCADVHLKESRPLIVSPRESPLSLIHIQNLLTLANAGVKIVPPMPAWYCNPQNLEEMIDFISIRLLDSLIDNIAPLQRWEGPN